MLRRRRRTSVALAPTPRTTGVLAVTPPSESEPSMVVIAFFFAMPLELTVSLDSISD